MNFRRARTWLASLLLLAAIGLIILGIKSGDIGIIQIESSSI